MTQPQDELDPQALREAIQVESTATAPRARLSAADRGRILRLAGRRLGWGMLFLVLLAVLGGGGWWAWSHRPAPPDGTLYGQVTDLSGHPLAAVRVQVEGFEETHTTLTDAEGRFSLPVPAGHRWVLIEQPGLSGVALEVQIQAGQTLEAPPVKLFSP